MNKEKQPSTKNQRKNLLESIILLFTYPFLFILSLSFRGYYFLKELLGHRTTPTKINPTPTQPPPTQETPAAPASISTPSKKHASASGLKVPALSTQSIDSGGFPQLSTEHTTTWKHQDVTFVISPETTRKINSLRKKIQEKVPIGSNLKRVLNDCGIQPSTLTNEVVLLMLLRTKKPKCFAESDVNGHDWTHDEFAILSEIGTCVANVTVYDDAKWGHKNSTPFRQYKRHQATLLFMNGPILKPDAPISKQDNCEFKQLVSNKALKQDAYKAYLERRLMLLLKQASDQAAIHKKKAYIALPGIGCGEFAGSFAHQLTQRIGGNSAVYESCIIDIIQNFTQQYPNHSIGCIRLNMGPAGGVVSEVRQIGDIPFVRSDQQGYKGHAMLAKPQDVIPQKYRRDDFEIFSVVAGDPVSFPGNDMYIDSKFTDEGAQGGATDLVTKITGIPGHYDQGMWRTRNNTPWQNIKACTFQALHCLAAQSLTVQNHPENTSAPPSKVQP